MGEVKGLLISALVNMINDDNREAFDKWLTDEDWKVVSGTLFATSWYPFSTYQHVFDAAVAVVAKHDEQTVYQWGISYSKKMLKGTYKIMLVPNDPLKSMEKNLSFESIFFRDVGNVEMKVTGEKRFEVRLAGFPREFKNLTVLKSGWYVGVLELAGAQNIERNFTSKTWKGDPASTIEYSFS
jgi:uncharacterized protein YbaA (DUF1428 family)